MSRTVTPTLDRTVFAYGSGRSGTTLLAKLLDASPETLYRHEPDKLLKEAALPFLPEAEDYEALMPLAARYLTALTRPASASVSGKRPRFPKAFRSPFGDWCQGALLPAYGAAERAGLALAVPDWVRSERFFYLIKSVSSVCRVPLFAKAAPNARFIHIVRHPGAVLASLLRGIEQQLMSRNVFIDEVAAMANAKDFDLPLDRLHELSFEEQATYAWMIQNDKSERELEDCDHYYLLSYEDLCLNTKERVREMCAFIGIEYVPQMEDFIGTMHGAAGDAGYFSVAKNPLGSIARWESQLGEETVARVNEIIDQSVVGQFVQERYASVRRHLEAKA